MKRSDFKDGEIYVLENYNDRTYYIKRNVNNREMYIYTDYKNINEGTFSESYSKPFRHATELEANYLNHCLDNNRWMSLEDFKKIQIPLYEIY